MDIPMSDLSEVAFHYFDRTQPEIIRLVKQLLSLGLTPTEVQQFAEERIGPCETTYIAYLVARHLTGPPN